AEKEVMELPALAKDARDIRQQGQQGQLRQLAPGAGGGFAFDRLERVARINPNIVTVREYAHTLRPNWTEGSRADFTETVYWNAGVKTDASGMANVTFNLSDSVTSFRVVADAFSQDGALGSNISQVESVQPFSIEPKIPLQVTSGDVIQLPITLVSGVSRELTGAHLNANGPAGITLDMLGNTGGLRPKERSRRLLQLDIGRGFSGSADLTFDGKAGPYHDSVTRTLDVQPLGFPHEVNTGGVLESNSSTS